MNQSYLLAWNRNKLKSWEKIVFWWLTQGSEDWGHRVCSLSFMDCLSLWGNLQARLWNYPLWACWHWQECGNLWLCFIWVWWLVSHTCIASLWSCLYLSIWLNGFVLYISKWKKNPTKKQNWAPLKPFQDFKRNVIVYYVHSLPLPSVVHWLIGQFNTESRS